MGESTSARGTLLRSISTLDNDDFHRFLQEHYGAFWGKLKFEDSLSDYSNDVSLMAVIVLFFCLKDLDIFHQSLLDNAPFFRCKMIKLKIFRSNSIFDLPRSKRKKKQPAI